MRVWLLTVLQASLREEKKLRVENAKLKKEIEVLKQELIQAEIRNGGEKRVVLCKHTSFIVMFIFFLESILKTLKGALKGQNCTSFA